MSSLPLKLFAATVVLAFAVASPVDAQKARKDKKVSAESAAARAHLQHRGTNLVPAGPLYFDNVYLGDDPDPNIRFQLWRDISGRLGGEP